MSGLRLPPRLHAVVLPDRSPAASPHKRRHKHRHNHRHRQRANSSSSVSSTSASSLSTRGSSHPSPSSSSRRRPRLFLRQVETRQQRSGSHVSRLLAEEDAEVRSSRSSYGDISSAEPSSRGSGRRSHRSSISSARGSGRGSGRSRSGSVTSSRSHSVSHRRYPPTSEFSSSASMSRSSSGSIISEFDDMALSPPTSPLRGNSPPLSPLRGTSNEFELYGSLTKVSARAIARLSGEAPSETDRDSRSSNSFGRRSTRIHSSTEYSDSEDDTGSLYDGRSAAGSDFGSSRHHHSHNSSSSSSNNHHRHSHRTSHHDNHGRTSRRSSVHHQSHRHTSAAADDSDSDGALRGVDSGDEYSPRRSHRSSYHDKHEYPVLSRSFVERSPSVSRARKSSNSGLRLPDSPPLSPRPSRSRSNSMSNAPTRSNAEQALRMRYLRKLNVVQHPADVERRSRRHTTSSPISIPNRSSSSRHRPTLDLSPNGLRSPHCSDHEVFRLDM
jgi:hypothetical protein